MLSWAAPHVFKSAGPMAPEAPEALPISEETGAKVNNQILMLDVEI